MRSPYWLVLYGAATRHLEHDHADERKCGLGISEVRVLAHGGEQLHCGVGAAVRTGSRAGLARRPAYTRQREGVVLARRRMSPFRPAASDSLVVTCHEARTGADA
jgi:hypothetical protein